MSVKRTKTDSILECHEKQQLQKELEAVPAQLDTKADAEEVNEKLDTKADAEEVNSKLDTKADSSVVAEQFNKKLDKTEFTGENVADLLEGIGWKGGEGSAAENNHILNGPNHGIKQINANVSGKDASAFGTGTASGNYAHAEGNGTKANGVSSHTEGNGTTANGNYSHAEGYQTKAEGSYAHAEGSSTTASGIASHAEGIETYANGNYSHAEGWKCYADGLFGDHAGGSGSVAASNHTVLFLAKAEGTEITIDSSGKYQPTGTVQQILKKFEAEQEILLLDTYYANASFLKRKVVSVDAESYKIVIDSAVSSEEASYKLLINPAVSDTTRYYPSYAEGLKCVSIGLCSHGVGAETTASWDYAYAEGYRTISSGTASHAEGNGSKANGNYSHAEGYYTTASVHYSHAEGYRTTASGSSAHAEGYHTTALNFQHTCGKYNATVDNTASSSTTNGTAFIIGNGTGDTARSNCFRVQYNGQVFGKGAYSSTGADYAELFEWEDGNPNQEDRRGKFVALQGTKLHIANSSDENIIGVISHKPSLIGNNHSEAWAKMYLTDMWGDEKKETKTIPAVYHQQEKEDGSFENILIEEAYEEEVPIINPAYDPSQTYIPRHERKEWGIVGMLGQLIAEDDGSCEPGGFCRCSEGGVATKSDAGYYVMERLDTHYIRILFR